MPNLTSYRAPPIHLYRELPKPQYELIRHEINYKNFLQQHIRNIHSCLSHTNKPHALTGKSAPKRKYVDHNYRLFHIYQRNLQLCQKILRIWTTNGRQQGGVDCHNESYRQHL